MICHAEQLRRCDKQPRTCREEWEFTLLLTNPDGTVVFGVDSEGGTIGDIDKGLEFLETFKPEGDAVDIVQKKALRAYLLAIKRARQEPTPRQGEDDE